MYLHPRFQQFIGALPIFRTLHWLGYFSAESPKPIHLYSNVRFLASIDEFRTQDWLPVSEGVVTRETTKAGQTAVTGDSGLKGTQAYPVPFGEAVASLYQRYAHDIANAAHRDISASDVDVHTIWVPLADEWTDACLVPVFALLRDITLAYVSRR
jgi:hypothetical protein